MRIGPFTFASDFFYSKTTWTVLGGVGYLIVQGFTHQMPWSVVIPGILAALGGLFHNDTVRKGNELTEVHRATVLSLAMSKPTAQVNLEEVLKAHGAVNKVAVAQAVAATVTAVLDRYAAQYEPPSEPRKPVRMAADHDPEPVDPNSKPSLTVVPGGTGTDAGSAVANAATLNEPEDGEADA